MSELPYAKTIGAVRGESGIITGDSIDELRKLPDEIAHMCVTSPPYWGLRDYGTRRWFGGDPACEHDRGIEHGPQHPGQVPQSIGKRDVPTSTTDGEMTTEEINRTEAVSEGQRATTFTCTKCGSWYGQIGLEPTPEEFVAHMVELFREVRRVLRKDGTLWLNIGDTYSAGCMTGKQGSNSTVLARTHWGTNLPARRPTGDLKPKDLVGIPWMLAFALRADGWYLRSDIVWFKRNVMPESVQDRPTRCHEHIFLLSKSQTYFYDTDAIREPHNLSYVQGRKTFENGPSKEYRQDRDPRMVLRYDGVPVGDPAGRNKRDVWDIPPRPYKGAHFAVFPMELPETCIKAGTSEKGCCPNCGAPWERQVERTSVKPEDYEGKWSEAAPQSSGRRMSANAKARRKAGGNHDNPFPVPPTAGWRPTCRCGVQETLPCVVLEPFAGSGTTLAAAAGLHRHWLGIEINPEYRALIEGRLKNDYKGSPTARAQEEQIREIADNLPQEP